jgi:hypothetical protein
MAFNGSGVFVRLFNWATDKTNSVAVTASRMDSEMDGMATGLSTCITKDGQQTATARIPFSTGVSATGSVSSVAYAQTNDIDTGLYFPNTNEWGLSAGGTGTLTSTASALTLTGSLTVSNGLGVTAGGLSVTAGGLSVTAGGLVVVAGTTAVTALTSSIGISVTTNGITLANDRSLIMTSQTSSAASAAGTLTNAPTAGNPGFWLKVTINGTSYAIPCWAG